MTDLNIRINQPSKGILQKDLKLNNPVIRAALCTIVRRVCAG